MRPFVRKIAQTQDVWLTSPWPDLYRDEPRVHLVRYKGSLRTQRKNADRQAARYGPPHKSAKRAVPTYSQDILARRRSVVRSLEVHFGLSFEQGLFRWEPPAEAKERAAEIIAGRQVCLYRLPTLRSEWLCRSRNPDREVMRWLFQKAMETHHVIAIADLLPKQEWLDVEEEEWPEAYLHGEIDYAVIAALMQQADIVLAPVGFTLPMGLAVGARLLTVFGGHAPSDWLTEGLDRTSYVPLAPLSFCFCNQMDHNCGKGITLEQREAAWDAARRLGERAAL